MDRTLLLFFYPFILILMAPQLPLLFFAPFLVITYYKKSFIVCLWYSLICGLLTDLLSDHHRFGFYALSYCLTTFFLYSQRVNYFEDRFTTVPLMTAFFSFGSTLIHTLILSSLGDPISLSWKWIQTDLFWMPLVDALYAAIAFSLPSLFIPKAHIRRTRLFSLKEPSDE